MSSCDHHQQSLSSPLAFWSREASHLSWTRPPKTILGPNPNPSSPRPEVWFPDGELIASYNLITRHILAGRGQNVAIVWESPVTGGSRKVTYDELQEEVEVLAGVLKDLGVGRGARVLVYMPMIPEALIALLACTHIGAVHVVVFGGFAPAECAKRIDSAKPTVVLTASCGVEGKRKTPYLPFIREAIAKATYKPMYTLLHNRPGLPSPVHIDKAHKELDWDKLVRSFRLRRALPDRPNPRPPFPNIIMVPGTSRNIELGEALPATAPHYILHTSGTTGTPKGVTRPLSHLVGLSYQIRELFEITHSDTMFSASDIGWVVGHSYIVYAPLLAGATTVLYEGKPIGTPDARSFWRIIETYQVKSLFCAPSALRGIVREDPNLDGMAQHNLSSLKSLFLAGERSEPTLVSRFQNLLQNHCSPETRVVDNWWSTESGSPITGLLPGQPLKPGSAGKPLPGWDVRIVSDSGLPVEPGKMGNVVLSLPLGPTAMSGLWGEEARFRRGYFDRFHGRYMDTGDVGVMDSDGYLTIVARSDDVINVSAHRLGTAILEGAVATVAEVREAYIVPMKDDLKGQIPVAFVVLDPGVPAGGAEEEEVKRSVKEAVRREVGAIAGLREVVRIAAEVVPRTRSGKVMRRGFRSVLEGVMEVPNGGGVGQEAWEEGVVRECRRLGLVPENKAKL